VLHLGMVMPLPGLFGFMFKPHYVIPIDRTESSFDLFSAF
jgi:hypothetical protein